MPPKTASSSVFQTMKNSLNTKDFLEDNKHYHLNRRKAATNKTNPNWYRHSSLEEVVKDFPCASEYLKFSFVRNPWDRILSLYLYKIKKNAASDPKWHEVNITFQDYLKKVALKQMPISKPQFDYFKDPELMTFIGRFENLQQDFDIICDKIGIPQQQLPHVNKTKHKHYTEYYDDEMREIVAEKYAKDIDYFGYEFGE